MRLVFLLLLVTLLFIQVPMAAAIVDPDSISIERCKVFHGVWESGDWLFVTEYKVMYAVDPTEDPEDTFLTILFDETSAVVGTRELSYYDHNVTSLYFTSSEATSAGLSWGDLSSYKIRVSGNPTYFPALTEDVNMDTLLLNAVSDGFNGSITSNRDSLGDLVIDIAGELQDSWTITLLTGSNKLNAAGKVVFDVAIPGLEQILPNIFETSASVEDTPLQYFSTYIYPNGDSDLSISFVSPVIPVTHFDKVRMPLVLPDRNGVVDSGSTTAIIDAEFTQDNNYWNGWTVTITDADGAAPEDESRIVGDFDSATDKFTFPVAFSAAVQIGDKFKLSSADKYVYSLNTSGQSDSYTLDDLNLPNSSEVFSVVAHYTISSSDGNPVYAYPYIVSGSYTATGGWHYAKGTDKLFSFAEVFTESGTISWTSDVVDSLEVGILLQSGDGVSEARCSSLMVEVVYSGLNPSGAYAEEVRDNMGLNLKNAFTNLGEWLGTPYIVVAAIGAMILFFMLVGRIFVATGSTQAAIALSAPLLVLGAYLGLIPMVIVFAVVFAVLILFGITFILARLA